MAPTYTARRIRICLIYPAGFTVFQFVAGSAYGTVFQDASGSIPCSEVFRVLPGDHSQELPILSE